MQFIFVFVPGNVYNIPIKIWLLGSHPFQPPLVYVTPTSNMVIKPGKHVDCYGRVYLPYLTEWKSVSCMFYEYDFCCSSRIVSYPLLVLHPFIRSFIHNFIFFIHSLTHSFIHSLIHSFINSFIHSYIHSCMHSFHHSCSFAHLFIHSIIHFFHSINHSFTHLVMHSASRFFIHSFIKLFIHSFITLI